MWCTEVAAGAFLTFGIVVSGDIGHHGCSPRLWNASLKFTLGKPPSPMHTNQPTLADLFHAL